MHFLENVLELHDYCMGSSLSLFLSEFQLKIFCFFCFQEGNFAAWKSGGLKPGQILLQVDDTPIRGMTSGVAVLTLRKAYSNPDSAVLKLLVRDI